jgi:predicted RNA-binding protein with PUA-like domain
MATYLLKTEPGEYSFDDLERDKVAVWDGVASNASLKHMRSISKGDEAYIYHSGDEKQIVGLARITSEAYPDPNSKDPKRLVFDVKPIKRARTLVSLAEIKAENRFADFPLVRQPRLSVMPVPAPLDSLLRGMTGL